MKAEQILSITLQKGIILEAHGDLIKYKAPPGAMTQDLIETIRMHKPSILALLDSDRVHTKCLGVECNHARYQDVSGSPWLWCGHIDKAVVNLMACPFDSWQKDQTGFPRTENRRAS